MRFFLRLFVFVQPSLNRGSVIFIDKTMGKCENTPFWSADYVKMQGKKCENRKYLNRKGRYTSFIIQNITIFAT